MTFGEIATTIEAVQEFRLIEMKDRAMMDYRLADLVAASCARLMDNKAKFPAIHEAYPALFEAPKVDVTQNWEKQKEILMKYAKNNNRRRAK